jgi:hypothetical protein
MQFVSDCHRFCVRMLKTFWTQSFPPSCICQLTAVWLSPAVPYKWTDWSFGNSLVSAADCPRKNWAQDTTDIGWQKKKVRLNTPMNMLPKMTMNCRSTVVAWLVLQTSCGGRWWVFQIQLKHVLLCCFRIVFCSFNWWAMWQDYIRLSQGHNRPIFIHSFIYFHSVDPYKVELTLRI